jgi:hypothetical protein
MNSFATEIGLATTTITRLARTDAKAGASLRLDLTGKSLTALEVDI